MIQEDSESPGHLSPFPWSAQLQGDNTDQILQALSSRVATLLETDMEFLMQSLYRFDVDERQVREVFSAEKSAESIADALARLIWDRELQKRYWRQRYAPGHTDPVSGG